MLVSEKHKAVVLHLRNPAAVMNVIPGAVARTPKDGISTVVVPWGLDETRILNNLGFEVPSPIKHLYEWSAGPNIKPFVAQKETAAFLTMHPRAFVLSQMGTGKTLALLWAFDYLKMHRIANKLLIVSPLSSLERTWGDEIFKNFPHLDFTVLHGSRKRRLDLLAEDFDVYIINHDGIKVISDALRLRKDIDTVCIDEIAAFRNSSTDRWKRMKHIVAGRPRVWGMTGTPIPNQPTDAWAQIQLVNPSATVQYFSKFRDMTMYQRGLYDWLPRDNATETVFAHMQPAIRYTRDECVDLPPVLFETRTAPLTKEQDTLYKQMLVKLKAEYAGGQILAVNEAVKLSKLVQIAVGVAYDNDGEDVVIPSKPRIAVVEELIEQSNSKTIVFVPFVGALKHVAVELEQAGYSVAIIHGGVSKNERDGIFSAFQRNPDPHVLVAQPGAMSHSLTLTAASTIVWFAPVTSNEIYEQANARITRPGQQHSQLIAHIEGTPVERRIYQRLQNKQKIQGTLLDMIRDDKK